MTRDKREVDFLNLQVGAVFRLGLNRLKVVEEKVIGGGDNPCEECYIFKSGFEVPCNEFVINSIIPECCGSCRKDKKDVYFEVID